MKRTVLLLSIVVIASTMYAVQCVTAGVVTYTYDDAGRLTNAFYEGKVIQYVYDNMGNMTKRTVAVRSDPVLDIKVNDSDGPVDISTGAVPALGLELKPGSWENVGADYWLAKIDPGGKVHCLDPSTGSWIEGITPVLTGPVFDIGYIYPLLSLPDLTQGQHNFYFIIDTVKNGALDFHPIFWDQVVVNVGEAP